MLESSSQNNNKDNNYISINTNQVSEGGKLSGDSDDEDDYSENEYSLKKGKKKSEKPMFLFKVKKLGMKGITHKTRLLLITPEEICYYQMVDKKEKNQKFLNILNRLYLVIKNNEYDLEKNKELLDAFMELPQEEKKIKRSFKNYEIIDLEEYGSFKKAPIKITNLDVQNEEDKLNPINYWIMETGSDFFRKAIMESHKKISNYIEESEYNITNNNEISTKIMTNNIKSQKTDDFNIIYDVKVQKQLLDYAKEIKNGLINIKENHILIKCISSSESIYKQELLKLIDRSIAENIIVLLIEKFYRNFKTFDLNLNVLSDLEHYYKDEPEKFNKIKNSNKEKIDKLLEDKKNNEPNKNANKMYFNSPISTANQNISVDELNQMLEFLFYIKEQGNFTAHPKNIEPVVINPNSHEYKISTKNENLDDIRRKMRDFLTKEFKNKSFLTPIKPAYAFECIFESKFNHLINSSDNKDINNNINNILEQALSQMNELKRDETIFDNIIERINKLEEIYKSFMAEEINEKDINIPKSLGNFFKRVSKILEHENEENCISFLYELNQKQFENSVTGENCVFFSMCLNYIIYKILPEIKSKINNLKKMTENARNLIKSKDEIIFFLTNLNSKLGSMDEFNKYESIIDPKKIAEYFNKSTNNSIKGEIDLGKIRDNLSKLVTSSFDWTSTKNCKLSTLLYLKQNNK